MNKKREDLLNINIGKLIFRSDLGDPNCDTCGGKGYVEFEGVDADVAEHCPNCYTGKYDSTKDTLRHKFRVQSLISNIRHKLFLRGENHDDSKLESPEKELFDEFTPKLKGSTYGSEEYKENLKGLGPALEHHYANNSHHPEHYENGIYGMCLLDLIEMLADWKAATERHDDGDLMTSLKINKERFKMDDTMYNLLVNTARKLGYMK